MRELAAAAQAAQSRKVDGWVLHAAEHHAAARSCSRSPIAPPARPSFRTPGIAPSAAAPTTRAPPLPVWPSCARRRPNCSATPTTRPGSWPTRWPRRRKRRSSSWMRWCPPQPPRPRARPRTFRPSSTAQHGGFTLQPWDWNFYSEQVRKAKYRSGRGRRPGPTSS